MNISGTQSRVFTPPHQQITMMLIVLALVILGGVLLGRQLHTIFNANIYLNGFIGAVFVLGVLATFWQLAQLYRAIAWLGGLQAGYKGHELSAVPWLLASVAPMIREGRQKRHLATSSTRSILDSIATRLDEARDITRYITNLLIFLGLLGTFWGLSNTVPAVVDTIRSLAPQNGDVSDVSVFDRLMSGLESQLGGMGTAFASSLVGLAGSLVVGLLELFAGHGQNQFYRDLEEWLASFTRLGLVGDGEGPDGALVALLERVDEGLERTTEFAERAEAARIKAEERLGAAADIVASLVGEIERDRGQISQLVGEMRETRDLDAKRNHAILTTLGRMNEGHDQLVATQETITDLLEAQTAHHAIDAETRGHIRAIDKQLRTIADDAHSARQDAVTALRQDIHALIGLIDERTRPEGG